MRLYTFPAVLLVFAITGFARPERDLGRIPPLPPERAPEREPESLGGFPHLDLSSRSIKPSNATIVLSLPPAPRPPPLDLSISYSLSSPCLLYLSSVLTSSTFTTCLPLSLLLTTSTSYSTMIAHALTTSDFSALNALIAYTSSTGDCDAYFSGVLSAIGTKANCAVDLSVKTGNAVAEETRTAVGNYRLVREASAITDPDTGVYCYLEAVASDRPDDLYLWSLPSGIA